MVSNSQGLMEYSGWLFIGRDSTVWTIAMEAVRLYIFRLFPLARSGNSNHKTQKNKSQTGNYLVKKL